MHNAELQNCLCLVLRLGVKSLRESYRRNSGSLLVHCDLCSSEW